jgi:hypothetical protein
MGSLITVNVQGGAMLTFTANALHTPVKILASGDVTIDGTINIKGANGRTNNDPLAGTPGSEAQPDRGD